MRKQWMLEALKEAEHAFEKDEVPVGAILVLNGQKIASAHNLTIVSCNALAHAEHLVIQEGMKLLKTPYLEKCDLYVTLEPCAFCAGAIALSRVSRLFFGAYDPKTGFIEHNGKILSWTHHNPQIIGGVEEKACAELLSRFFRKIRLCKGLSAPT